MDSEETTNQESTDVLKDGGNYLWSCQRRSCHTSDTTVFALTLSKYKEKDAQDVIISLTTVNWLQIHVKKKKYSTEGKICS